jgi:YD repeat-containing protein
MFLLLALVPWLTSAAEKSGYFLQAGFSPITGAFEGRYQVSEQACRKMLCYRLTYDEQGRLTRVEHVIGEKIFYYDTMPYLKVETRAGVQKFSALNPQNVPVKIARLNYSMNGAEAMKDFEDKDIWQYQLTLDGKGRVTGFSNLDRFGNPIENADKIAQWAYRLDDEGRIVQLKSYNQHGSRANDYQDLVEYQELEGRLVRKVSHQSTKPGGPTLCEDQNGIATFIDEFDNLGNLVETRFFGLDGRPKNHKQAHAAVIRNQYDDRGNLVEQSLAGPEQEGKAKTEIVRYQYDDQGRLTKISFCDGSGRLKTGKNVVAIQKVDYREQEQALEISFLDADLKPVENTKYNAAKIISKYDAAFNPIEQKFLDVKGALRAAPLVPVYRMKYDDQANLVELAFLGKNEQLLETPRQKVAIFRFSYNNLGGLGEVGFYDKKGALKNRADLKIAGMQLKRDRQGRLLQVSYFDQNRKLKTYHQDVFKPAAGIRFIYDNRGLVLSGTYFDPYGKEILR